MKQLVEGYGTPLSRKYYILEWIIFLYATIRLPMASYLISINFEISSDIPYNIERHDPFMSFLKQHSGTYNEGMPLILYAMEIFNFVNQICLYKLNVHKNVWQLWYQLLVVNREQYYELMYNERQLMRMAKMKLIINRIHKYRLASIVPDAIIDVYARINSTLTIQLNLEHINRDRYLKKKLSHLPNLPHRIRLKLLNVLIIGDHYWCYFQLTVISLISGYYTWIAFTMDTSKQAYFTYLTINLEHLAFQYITFQILQTAILFTVLSYFATMIYTGHVLDDNRKMWNLIYERRRNTPYMKAYIPSRYQRIVDDQLDDYIRVTTLVLNGSRDLFGTILYNFLMTNIPINIYLLVRNVFQHPSEIEVVLVWIMIAAQLLAATVVLSLLSWSTAVYQKPANFMPVLQPMLKRSKCWLWYKMKYADLYHRLIDDGPQIGVSIGPIQTVTYAFSLEAFYIYFGYIMMAFSQMIEANLNVNKHVWQLWYQLLVINREQYYELMYSINERQLMAMAKMQMIINRIHKYRIASLVPDYIINVYAKMRSILTIQLNLEHINQDQYLKKKLKHLPNLPHPISTVSIISGYYSWVAFTMDTSKQAWYAYLIVNFEHLIFQYITFQILQTAIFFTVFVYLTTLVYNGHILDDNRKMLKLINERRRNSSYMKAYIPIRYKRMIDSQVDNYIRTTTMVLNGSSDLFSIILYNFLLTNIPINIYLLVRNIFQHPSEIESILMWLIIIGQLIGATLIFSLLSWSTVIYHTPANFIPVLQPMLNRSKYWLSNKIKYDDLYYRLIDGRSKIGVSIGPIKTVTYALSLEALYIYLGYILMAFSQMIEANVGKMESE
ncbi:hypothetical protein RDWZM_010386 [Blomia tropicalis]|uniref:Uncharacterized protein n=1 Tax=Blomia tropicalis TaxID=40697 RepID=A0A9Q0RIQ0_BLOTA|nr:hypothetical protein RDWZM_010386 [Blomia tropicalis]